MNNEEIIEKIKKLLRMKNGGTLAEIETALSLAQKLAQQHGIDINSIDENEPKREPITHDTINLRRVQIECKYAALIVQRFFNCNAVQGRGITFIGTKTNIIIAQYVYNFLVKRFRYEWNNNSGRIRNRQSFMDGMFQALYYKLAMMEPKPVEKDAIILANNQSQVNLYVTEHWGKLANKKVTPDRRASTAFRHGLYAGKNINIRSAVNSNQVQIKQLEN